MMVRLLRFLIVFIMRKLRLVVVGCLNFVSMINVGFV